MDYTSMYGGLLVNMAVFASTLMTLLFRIRDRVLRWQKGVVRVVSLPPEGSAVHVRGVGKSFPAADGSVVPAIDHVSLDLEAGELVSLVGLERVRRKSTLLRLVAPGSTGPRPRRGAGRRGAGSPARPPSGGLVFQDPNLFPWLTVRRNVEAGAGRPGVLRKQRHERWTSGIPATGGAGGVRPGVPAPALRGHGPAGCAGAGAGQSPPGPPPRRSPSGALPGPVHPDARMQDELLEDLAGPADDLPAGDPRHRRGDVLPGATGSPSSPPAGAGRTGHQGRSRPAPPPHRPPVPSPPGRDPRRPPLQRWVGGRFCRPGKRIAVAGRGPAGTG